MTPIALREDYGSASVHRLASSCDNADQARRLLSIAAVYDGMSRTNAARVGGMDRQTLRDWIHRFNEDGPAGLVNRKAPGAPARLTAAQLMELAALVEAGPDLVGNGVERWRCLDLMRWIEAQYGVAYCERSVSRLLHELGFSHVSARPRHAGQVPEVLEDFKKTSHVRWRRP